MEYITVNVDGITYRVRRRRMKSGRMGYFLSTGGHVHGRMSFVQVLIMDTVELSEEDRLAKRARNRTRKLEGMLRGSR